jgi:single-stranded-DNA-specific exonuclease
MKSITSRYWSLPRPYIATEKEKKLAEEFGVFPEIIRILSNRSIQKREELRRFLYPTLHDLENPYLMKGMLESCEVILSALQDDQDILIWGDYDVDGVTATALLVRFFRMLGKDVRWFIPNRFEDGYGLNSRNLQRLVRKSHQPLLITVDCGISNNNEILYAKSIGYRVIVTDHHEPGEGGMDADAVINPKQQGCNFKAKDISGVGISFYLTMGLRSFLKENGYFSRSSIEAPNLKQLLELVAIGTIADMVSLQGNNRVLVKAGFEVINTEPSTGVKALLKECDIRSAKITAEDIAFQLAPKINAAGRLAEASLAVELLLETEEKVAGKLARKLTLYNDKRKALCHECLEYTLSFIGNSQYKQENCFIAKVDDSVGILGIVASQVCEKFKVPIILVTETEDKKYGRVFKGSCRSVPGINIYNVLSQCRDHLIHFGGHPMAAGITLYEKEFASFKACFVKNIGLLAEKIPTEPECVDLELDIERALALETAAQMHLLEPFGMGNKKPVFVDKNVILQDIRKIGQNGDHLSFNKRGKFENTKCIAFRFGEYEHLVKNSATFTLLYSITISRYKNAEKWQAHLVDLLPA